MLRRLFLVLEHTQILPVSPGGRLPHRPMAGTAPPAWSTPGVLGAIAGVSGRDQEQTVMELM